MTVFRKNASSPEQRTVYFHNSYERKSSIHIHKSKNIEESTQPGVKPMQSSIPEYAVVRTKPIRHIQQGQKGNLSSNEKENEQMHDPISETNKSYYERVNVDSRANSNTILKSEYSFAREMEGDVENNVEELSNVGNIEYDFTNNTKHFNTSNNIYNTLQTEEEYGSPHNARSGDNTYNILNMPNDRDSQSVYDTTNNIDHSVATDNINNHLC